MGILTSFKSKWNASSTEEKINFVLDIVCGIGAGSICSSITKRYSAGMNLPTRICAAITSCGLGMAAGETACKAYSGYSKAIGNVIDKAKSKEDDEDGKYTRY